MSEAHVIGASRVPSVIPVLNTLVRRLVGAGMPFGPNVNLTVRGRTSGKLHTFPVAIIAVDGRRFVQSPFGEVNWVRNLRAAGEAVLTRGRRREELTAVEIPAEEGGPILRAAIAPYLQSRFTAPLAGRFFNLRRGSTPEEYVAEARRHPMFELLQRPAAR